MTIYNRPNAINQTILLSSAFIFAYCFGVILHELGHVLAYAYYGVSTDVFVIHPFGRNYMLPHSEVSTQWLHIVYSAGTVFNLVCATGFTVFLSRLKNPYLLPLMMLGGTSFIQESIGIILDLSGGATFDWSIVASTGLPLSLIVLLAISLLVIGCFHFLRIMAAVGVSGTNSYFSVLIVILGTVTPYFVFSLLYVIAFEEAKIEARLIALASSILLSIIIALVYRFINIQSKIESQKIETKHIRFTLLVTVVLLLVGWFKFN